MRTLLIAVVLAFVAAPAAEAKTVKVYFTRGEQIAAVKRTSANMEETVKALLAGPTPAEQAQGFGTVIPPGATLTSVKVEDDTARLSLSRDFFTKGPDMDARLAQLVYTLTSGTVEEISLRGHTYSRADFAPPEFEEPEPPALKLKQPKDVKGIQTKLASLGYLPEGKSGVSGTYDYRTMQAVLAFQSWEGLQRDGVVGPNTLARLQTAGRPLAMDRAPGRRVEIYRARGVLLLVDGARVTRAIHTSTGTGGDSPDLGTPPGRFAIYRKEEKSWSVPYKSWLPWAAYWNGGWAIHGYADVPSQPASHGCARVPLVEAQVVYSFVAIGTPVRVV
jgi:hypothetical protein